MDILSKVFATTSPQVVRQVIKDDENENWQEWKIQNENGTRSEICKIPPSRLLPDIQSVSYSSDGNKLNVTLWLTKIYSEEVYQDIPRNKTFSNITEIPSDIPSSSQSSNLSRSVQFVMAIDIVSVLDEGIDYTMELSSPTYDNPNWTENVYEISESGNKKLAYTKTFDTFPFNDKKFVDFSIDLKLIGNPDKYKLLFYVVDKYFVNGEQCRKIDTSNWSLIPAPEFNIVPDISHVELRPHQEKNILININTDSVLESNAVLGVDYPKDDNEEEKKLNISLIPNNINISKFGNNSATLHIAALDELKEPKKIITVSANISFPKTVINRGGDTYYVNKSISMSEYSYLTLTILPPLSINEKLGNFVDAWISPLGAMWAFVLAVVGGIPLFMRFISKNKKKKENDSHDSVVVIPLFMRFISKNKKKKENDSHDSSK
jgi:hypothetical protein